MYFDNFADFLAMGGHGLYVWGSYGLMAAGLALLIIGSLRGQRRWLHAQRRLLQRQKSSRSSNPTREES